VTHPRVLLVDDHELVLKRVRGLVESAFEVVGVARTGIEMVSEALRLCPDVIVADIAMPSLDGIEAYRQLQERQSTAKIVYLTIHDEKAFVRACLAVGATGYVIKSHMKTDLVTAINSALSGHLFVSPSVLVRYPEFA
jgi:DNA-binding NarL/FixJ family response regulator